VEALELVTDPVLRLSAPSRFSIFFLVSVAHLLAVYCFLRQYSSNERLIGQSSATLDVTFVDEHTPEAPLEAARAHSQRLSPETFQRLPEPDLPDIPSLSPLESQQAPDRIFEPAADAAAFLREKERGVVQKSFGHDFSALPTPTERSIFGPRSNHPAGTVESFGDSERYWVSENCYYDLTRMPTLPGQQPDEAPHLRCKGGSSGRTHLFKPLEKSPPQDGGATTH